MKVVFRTDASIEMGTGHVMRCLTLANALKKQGAECHFICRAHKGHLIPLIIEHGHSVHSLTAVFPQSKDEHAPDSPQLAHASWLGCSQTSDAHLCQSIVQEIQPDWLVVDHYALDIRWHRVLRPHSKKIMVIDDLADRQHDCDLLLDQTFARDADDYRPRVPQDCQLLCGAEYALLRPEFPQWREYSLQRRQKGQLEQLLINLGGVDKDNITGQVLDALSGCEIHLGCRIVVVMGATAPWLDSVRQQAEALPWKTEIKVGVNNMAELMADSDLAIGAAGATTWERCCLGLPSIMIVLAENQQNIAFQLANSGAAVVMQSNFKNSDLTRLISIVQQNQTTLVKNAHKICDGQGVQRVIERLDNQNEDQFFMQ